MCREGRLSHGDGKRRDDRHTSHHKIHRNDRLQLQMYSKFACVVVFFAFHIFIVVTLKTTSGRTYNVETHNELFDQPNELKQEYFREVEKTKKKFRLVSPVDLNNGIDEGGNVDNRVNSHINEPSNDETNERNKESKGARDASKKKEREQRHSINGARLFDNGTDKKAILLTSNEDKKNEIRAEEITNKGRMIKRAQQDLSNESRSIDVDKKTENNQNTTLNENRTWQTKQSTNDKTYNDSGRNKIEALWKGSSPYGNNTTKFNRIILVLSGCDEHLHWLHDFTKGFSIQQINLFAKCNMNTEDLNHTASSLRSSTDIVYHPFVGGSTLAFSRWISSSLSILNDDDVVVFLKGDYHVPSFDELRVMEHRHSRRRSLSEILQATSVYDFGCLAEITGWSDADMSTYHVTNSLMEFQSSDAQFIKNMEDWLQLVNMTLPHPLTSVCYGGEFAVTAKQIKMRDIAFWKNWEKKVEKTFMMSVHPYAERSWAGMFSSPLSETDRAELLRFKTGVSREEPFDGALLHHEVLTTGNRPEILFKNEFPDHSTDDLIDAIWTGDILDGNSSRFDRVFVVISHCNNPLEWYDDFVKDVEIYQTIIYSKCDSALPNVKSASFETLEDVGQADHTFAHFMANLPTNITDDDVIVFLKDNITSDDSDSPFKSRSLYDMLRIASGKGFGCRMQFKSDFVSAYHSEPFISSLNHNKKDSSKRKQKNPEFSSSFKTLEDWLHSVNGCLPTPLTEVCYGGGFAVDATRIKRRKPKFWKGIEKSLSRGSYIEESRYAERSWAGLLSKPLSADSLVLIKNNKNVKVKDMDHRIGRTLTREGSKGFLKSVEATWRGDAVGGNPYSFDRLFIVLSFCSRSFKWLDGFVYPFIVHDLTIYSRCKNDPVITIPTKKSTVVNTTNSLSADYVYAHWMAKMSSKLKDNDGVIFLNDGPSRSDVFSRSLKDMLRIASVTGFGCMVELEDDYSAYRDFKVLSKIRRDEGSTSLGDWSRSVNVTLPEPYTNVCYGGNFAVKASQIKKHPQGIWKRIKLNLSYSIDLRWLFRSNMVSEKNLLNYGSPSFATRVWGGLFTKPLSEQSITFLKEYSTGMVNDVTDVMRVGALRRKAPIPFFSEVEPLWKGDIHGGDPSVFRRIYVVVSHCANELDEVNEFIKGFDVHNVTIYSKCVVSPINVPKNATLHRLPNVGRCDHTYAHWMATMSSSLNDDDAVLFLKDTHLVHQRAKTRRLADMLRIASVSGFGCWLELTDDLSTYHLVSELSRFKKSVYNRTARDSAGNFYSDFNDLGHWLSSIGGSLPEPYTQVCYGGRFAVKASQIKLRPPEFWSAIAKSLSRGDNIEEGHYAERSWAGLLAKPLSRDNMKSLRQYASIHTTENPDYQGSLKQLDPGENSFKSGASWKGDVLKGDLSIFRRISLVISYCQHSLSWIPDFTKDFLIHSTTIYSKCDQKPDYVPPNTIIVALPNVGGHHHTFSHWMANIKPDDIKDTDAIVFLTDDQQIRDWGRPRSLYEMLNIASRTGFGCRLTPIKTRDFAQSDISEYHFVRSLLEFQANGAKIRFGRWAYYMHLEMPKYYMRVCYGGNFAVKGSQFRNINKSSYVRIEKTLLDATNVFEQYAERVWAGIFSDYIENNDVYYLQRQRTEKIQYRSYEGALIKNYKSV